MMKVKLALSFFLFLSLAGKMAAQGKVNILLTDTQAIDFSESVYEKMNVKLWNAAAGGIIHAYKDAGFKEAYSAKQVRFELGSVSEKKNYAKNDNPNVLLDTILTEIYYPVGTETLKLLPISSFKDNTLKEVSSILMYNAVTSENTASDPLFYMDASECLHQLNDTETLLLSLMLEYNSHESTKNIGEINEKVIASFSMAYLKNIEITLYNCAQSGRIRSYENDSFKTARKLEDYNKLGGYYDQENHTFKRFNPNNLQGFRIGYNCINNGLDISSKLFAVDVLYKPFLGDIATSNSYPMFSLRLEDFQNQISAEQNAWLLGLCYHSFLMQFDQSIWKYGSKFVYHTY